MYYYKKKYEEAISLYKQAYDLISVQADIDYDVFARIVNRICDYKVLIRQTDEAIKIYQSSIMLLVNSGPDQNNLALAMLLKLANLYSAETNNGQTISCYEKIIRIAKEMPKSNYYRQNLVKYLKTLKDLYTGANLYQKAAEIDSEIIKEKRFSFAF